MEPKQKILIVDDSEINRAMLKEILGEGYEYLEAENGLRAIEISAQTHRYRAGAAGPDHAGNGRL